MNVVVFCPASPPVAPCEHAAAVLHLIWSPPPAPPAQPAVQVQHAREAGKAKRSLLAAGAHHRWVCGLLLAAHALKCQERHLGRAVGLWLLVVCACQGKRTLCVWLPAASSLPAGIQQINDSQLLSTAGDGRLMVWDLRNASAGPVKFALPDSRCGQ